MVWAIVLLYLQPRSHYFSLRPLCATFRALAIKRDSRKSKKKDFLLFLLTTRRRKYSFAHNLLPNLKEKTGSFFSRHYS